MADTVYFSVDVEASGPVPGLYNLVSIGAVPVGRDAESWKPEDERFYVELKPIGGSRASAWRAGERRPTRRCGG